MQAFCLLTAFYHIIITKSAQEKIFGFRYFLLQFHLIFHLIKIGVITDLPIRLIPIQGVRNQRNGNTKYRKEYFFFPYKGASLTAAMHSLDGCRFT